MNEHHGIEAGEATKALIGRVVGAVRLHKPVEYTDRSYETAAWWEARRSETGVFPLVLRKRYHFPHTLYLEAEVPAVVTDDYFPALWGGVAVSSEPYRARNVGQARTISVAVTILSAVQVTGILPSTERDLYLDPEAWPSVLSDVEAGIDRAHEYLESYWTAYRLGDDELLSRIGMVAHMAEKLAELGRASQLLQRAIRREAEDGHLKRCRIDNSAWARDLLAGRAA